MGVSKDRASEVAVAAPHERQARYGRALMELTRCLWREDKDLAGMLACITEAAARTLEVERVNIWRFDEDGMRCIHAVGWDGADIVHGPPGFDEVLQIDHTAYAATLPAVRVIDADDVDAELATSVPRSPLTDYFDRYRIQSVMDAPVRVEDGLVGVICHEHCGDGLREWTAEELAFAGNMADFVALAIEIDRRKAAESRLDYLAFNDPVTGRANRRYFLTALQRELGCIRRGHRRSAVLFVDIDRFGALNASAGESAGDAVLVAIGERLQALLPAHGLIARVESDCFGVLLPDLAQEWEATTLASDILHAISDAHRVRACTPKPWNCRPASAWRSPRTTTNRARTPGWPMPMRPATWPRSAGAGGTRCSTRTTTRACCSGCRWRCACARPCGPATSKCITSRRWTWPPAA